jgi:hypothetical protein
MKPKLRNQYPTGQRELVRAGCVTLAKLLGDDLRDHITLVGGVVPLLVVPESIQAHDPHPGTLDLDIGVAVSVAKASEALLHDRLMAGGFVRDRGEARWQYPAEAPVIWLDTIPEGGWLPEISLAFRDRDNIRLHGLDLTGTPARHRTLGDRARGLRRAQGPRLRSSSRTEGRLRPLVAPQEPPRRYEHDCRTHGVTHGPPERASNPRDTPERLRG